MAEVSQQVSALRLSKVGPAWAPVSEIDAAVDAYSRTQGPGIDWW
jgi:hypothetical protein